MVLKARNEGIDPGIVEVLISSKMEEIPFWPSMATATADACTRAGWRWVANRQHLPGVRPAAPARRPSFTAEAKFRLQYVVRPEVAVASFAFGGSGAKIYQWLARYDPADLTILEPRYRRPKRPRRHQLTAG